MLIQGCSIFDAVMKPSLCRSSAKPPMNIHCAEICVHELSTTSVAHFSTLVRDAENWPAERYERRQLPLKLAWALTVHKMQGLTLRSGELKLARVFEPRPVWMPQHPVWMSECQKRTHVVCGQILASQGLQTQVNPATSTLRGLAT